MGSKPTLRAINLNLNLNLNLKLKLNRHSYSNPILSLSCIEGNDYHLIYH